MPAPLIPVVGAAVKAVGGVLTARAERKKAESQAHAEVMKRRAEGDLAAQSLRIRGMDGSWKDEFWTIILGCGIFVPVLLAPIADYIFNTGGIIRDTIALSLADLDKALGGNLGYVVVGAIVASFGLKALGK